MPREDIDRLLARQEFIPGIYKYCDRWCERCPQTSRCLNFAVSSEHFGDSKDWDLTNEVFWQKLGEMLSLALEMVRETAREMGIDLDALMDEKDTATASLEPGDQVVHLIFHLAKSYARQVDVWFSDNVQEAESIPERPRPRLLDQEKQKQEIAMADALEVIRWYQHLIYVKLRRAQYRSDDDDVSSDECPSNADGSAKVALVGIDRSISAWGVLAKHLPDHATGIARLIRLLESLRQRVVSEFPNAPGFVRPGTDRTVTVS